MTGNCSKDINGIMYMQLVWPIRTWTPRIRESINITILEEMEAKSVDFAIMMDFLEYIEDDVGYVGKVAEQIRNGGLHCLHIKASFPSMIRM